ncbi:cilia- and flagella-associated protein 157-like [Vespa mandarinia]|uniref:cilia- and flagella-associated protein 157-like n=1 Tax=Vespa mandarinia TaxID=7446 RepID=UPI00160A9E50|nr:cilia- and flagella-associated protein 157-like [Vespa mandarinia]
MVDLEKYKTNISLPKRLQSPDPKNEKNEKISGPVIINMQKAFYDLKISDINNRIQRLQERNNELTDNCEEINLLLISTDAETANEITQLTQNLSNEVTKLEENKNTLSILEEGIVNDKFSHIDKMNSLNDKYARKRLELISLIKPLSNTLLDAKINMLEDYRKSQSVLQEKLENKNIFMQQEEEKVEQQIQQIQLKFKFDREKLKKDMYNRLLDSAGIFQMEISKCIQEPIHKLIRENIMLNNYLTEIMNGSFTEKEIFKNSKDMKDVLLKKNKLSYLDTRYNIKVSKIQNHLLKSLKEVHSDIERHLINFKVLSSNLEKDLINRDYAQKQTNISEAHVKKLEVMLYKERIEISTSKYIRKKIQCKIKKCRETLYDVKYAVICALQMANSDSKFAQMDKKSLLLHLQNIIIESQAYMSNIIIKSMESILESSNVYIYGDLGFEPTSIKLRESTQIVENEIFTPIISETFGIKELEEQSKEDLIKDKSLTIFEAPTVKELIETKFSSAEDSISEEFEVTGIDNDEI